MSAVGNLTTPIETDRSGHDDPGRRVALPPADADSDPHLSGAPCCASGRDHFIDTAHGDRRRPDGGRRDGPPLGRSSHRRHLANAQRPTRAARGERTVRARAQSALRRQHRAVGRLRDRRASRLDGAGDRGAPRRGVSRDCPVGRTAARIAAGRRLSGLRRAGAALAADVHDLVGPHRGHVFVARNAFQ